MLFHLFEPTSILHIEIKKYFFSIHGIILYESNLHFIIFE